MGVIRQLPPELVNQIAAGEVIERPAAAVKELVENSLDAGATHIHVSVADGGRRLIRVADDGCGMSADDLPLAVASHATSKLRVADDLFNVRTLGFRGEAVASIASVAELTIITRQHDQSSGWQLRVRGGEHDTLAPASASPGTCIEVRELFFNTPARRKFLKTARAELAAVNDAITRLALCHPQVSFVLDADGSTVLDWPAVQTPAQRLADAFGTDLAQRLLPVAAEGDALTLVGYCGRPIDARPTTRWQYLYVNGRYVRDRHVSAAVKEAYHGLIEVGRFPIYFVFLHVHPSQVDVNVHPTKVEVRFAEADRVRGTVYRAMRAALGSADLVADLQPSGGGGVGGTWSPGEQASTPMIAGDPDPAEQDRVRAWAAREMLAELDRLIAARGDEGPPLPGFGAFAPEKPGDAAGRDRTVDAIWSPSAASEDPFQPVPSQTPAVPSMAPAPAAMLPGAGVEHASVGMQELGGTNTHPFVPAVGGSRADLNPHERAEPLATAAAALSANANGHVPGRPAVLQILRTYLVADDGDGLLIADQHALHERVLYQEFMTRLTTGTLEAQRMLVPEPLTVTAAQVEAAEQYADLLIKLGFELAEFGPRELAIHAMPLLLRRVSPATFVSDLLDELADAADGLTAQQVLHHAVATMACKAAVKAGDLLTADEMHALLQRVPTVEHSAHCPHGRPTMLRLGRVELERQFHRTR